MNENKKIEPTEAMVEAGASYAWEETNPGILGWNSISERHKEGCRRDARAVLAAALNHPDAHGLFADEHGPTLPATPGAVITPADGREFIEAGDYGRTYLAREAVLSYGCWYAAWRTGDGKLARRYVTSGDIVPGTWKKADQ